MPIATILPMPRNVFYDGNGDPLVGGFVATLVPNTLTPKTTWQDAAETTPNANPILLDSGGSCLLYGSGAYDIVTTDSLGNSVAAYSGVTTDSLSAAQAEIDAIILELETFRIPVTANTIFYVNGLLGTDSLTHGLTSGTGAFKTIQYAIDTIQGYYDGKGFNGTISVADGIYNLGSASIQAYGFFVGFDTMTLSCTATPGSVQVITSNANAVLDVEHFCELYVNGGFIFEPSTSGVNIIQALNGGRVYLSGITVFPVLLGVQFYASRDGYIEFQTTCFVTNGTTFNLFQSSHGGEIRLSNGAAISFNSDHNYTDATIYVDHGAVVITAGGTFTLNGHTVTGQRYRVAENGIIQWASVGGSANSIPGHTLGTETMGGLYFYGGTPNVIASGSTAINMATIGSGTTDFGIGFIPGEIEFLASKNGGPAGMMGSVGWCTFAYNNASMFVSSQGCVSGGLAGAQPNVSSCLIYNDNAGGSNAVSASVTGLTSDGNGFTIAWTTAGSPSGTLSILWKARRGV